MRKDENEMRAEYGREDLGEVARGKCVASHAKLASRDVGKSGVYFSSDEVLRELDGILAKAKKKAGM